MGNCLFVAMPYVMSDIEEGDRDEERTRSLFNDFQRLVGGIVVISPDRRRGVSHIEEE